MRLRASAGIVSAVVCVWGTAIGAGALLGGCALIDAGVSGRVVGLNASLDQSTNDTILANIVRASHYQPLTFVAVSKVGGSQQVTLANGLPTFTIGPNQTPLQHQFIFGSNNLSNQAGGSLDVVPLATKDFAKGVSVDISLAEISVLVRQGIPRDLVYNLVLDSVEFTAKGKRISFRNDPSDKITYEHFKAAILILVAFGYTIETRTDRNPFFDKDDKTTAAYITKGRFCFDLTLAEPLLLKRMKDNKIIMDDWWKCNAIWAKGSIAKGVFTNRRDEEREITVLFPEPYGRMKIRNVDFKMRSLYGVFNFLGRLIADGQLDLVRAATDNQAKAISDRLYKPEEAVTITLDQVGSPLLNLTNVPLESCFASVVVNGTYHCVPREDSDNTKRIFSILAQLLALKTTAVDLPSTPSVRITP